MTTLSRANSNPTQALIEAITLVQSGLVDGFPSNSALQAAATTVTIPPTPNNVVRQDALIFCLLFSDFVERYDEQTEPPVVIVASLVAKHLNEKRLATKNGATDCTADQCRFYSD